MCARSFFVPDYEVDGGGRGGDFWKCVAGGKIMEPWMQWLSLVGGIVIFLYGVFKSDWVLIILGLLIVAFTVSKMIRSGRGKGAGKGPGCS